jgi:carboxymethylenebutenolidase
MRLKPNSFVDLKTPTGPMRVHLFQPQIDDRRPAVILYSEIYQMTGPIARTAAMIAGQGYIVAVPEVYHEYAAPGEAFAYDKAGTDRGNELKITKPIGAFDSDARSVIDYLEASPECSGKMAAIGICLGGHLAFRAAMNPEILSTVCFYATDIHQGSLGIGKCDDSLSRIPEIRGELTMIWGRQDPHIPNEGRRKIYDALTKAGTVFSWLELNGEHAFMRDEGHRYDPAHAHLLYSWLFATLARMPT